MTTVMNTVACDDLRAAIRSLYGEGEANGRIRCLDVCQRGRGESVTQQFAGSIIIVFHRLIESMTSDQIALRLRIDPYEGSVWFSRKIQKSSPSYPFCPVLL